MTVIRKVQRPAHEPDVAINPMAGAVDHDGRAFAGHSHSRGSSRVADTRYAVSLYRSSSA